MNLNNKHTNFKSIYWVSIANYAENQKCTFFGLAIYMYMYIICICLHCLHTVHVHDMFIKSLSNYSIYCCF